MQSLEAFRFQAVQNQYMHITNSTSRTLTLWFPLFLVALGTWRITSSSSSHGRNNSPTSRTNFFMLIFRFKFGVFLLNVTPKGLGKKYLGTWKTVRWCNCDNNGAWNGNFIGVGSRSTSCGPFDNIFSLANRARKNVVEFSNKKGCQSFVIGVVRSGMRGGTVFIRQHLMIIWIRLDMARG